MPNNDNEWVYLGTALIQSYQYFYLSIQSNGQIGYINSNICRYIHESGNNTYRVIIII